jgi:hypothetical protein
MSEMTLPDRPLAPLTVYDGIEIRKISGVFFNLGREMRDIYGARENGRMNG